MPDLSDRGTLSVSRAEIDQRDPTFRVTPDGGQAFTVLLVQRTLNIGSEARQDIPIQSPGILARHARLLMEGSNYRLYDLTEHSGVLVNGHPIEGSCILRDGDTVRLQDQARRGATLNYSNPVERALGSASVGKLYPLEPLPFVIGRDKAANLPLDALAVSWHHAVITEQGNAHILTDQGSTNGTFVNDRRVTAPYHLRLEDVIRIDQILLVYKGKALVRLAATQRFQLDATDVEMTYRTGFPPRPLNTMRSVSISVQPKEFIVIIGGSGSGKSTLLRALNGANRATGGKVLVNGSDLYANYELYQPIIGYVPQADIVQDTLTVYQSLVFGARLRFPNEPKASREQRVERVLDALELTDFRDRLVGRLSGGQKKRVSIALELMAEPSLLFMDEPTSGLDPGLDKSMMNTLRRLADRGHIVIVVTHTTLNIDLCDKLIFMSRGNLVYFGPPREALTFFGAHDYSEVYNRVMQSPESLQRASSETMLFERAAVGADNAPTEQISAGDAAKLWAEKYRATPLYNQNVLKRQQQQPPQVPGETALTNKRLRGSRRGTFMQQARVLTARAIALLRRDFRTIFAMLLVLPLVGLFLGLISVDPIDKSRGQMLVSRGDSSAYLLLMDKLPLQPVAPVEVVAKSATPGTAGGTGTTGSSKAGGGQGVSAIGTFAPANEAQRLLFMASLAVTLFGVFASAYTIVAEKSLFLRERMVNLRIAPYLASKVMVYSVLAMISSILLLLTLSIGVHLPEHGLIMWGPLELFITMTLTAIAGVSIGILLSALNREVNAVTYAVLAILFVQILLPGVLFKMDGALEPISRLTVTRWSLEAMGGTVDMTARDTEGRIVVQTTAVNPRTGKPLVGAVQPRQFFPAPPALSVTYPASANDLLIRWGALIAFSVVFLIGASLALNRSESF